MLWGLQYDPEKSTGGSVVLDCQRVIASLSPRARKLVQMSPISSGSHAKLLLHDQVGSDSWVAIVGSCNFLQTAFKSCDVSIRLQSSRATQALLAHLIVGQQPASGGWSSLARRLNHLWGTLRGPAQDTGEFGVTLLVDADHYACVRQARDEAQRSIVLGCDIYGLAADTSVLVPLTTAANDGKRVRILYQRRSRSLVERGIEPTITSLAEEGLSLETVAGLHGKFLVWDTGALAVTSFNWLATTVDGTRTRSAELGLLLRGPDVRGMLGSRLMEATSGRLAID